MTDIVERLRDDVNLMRLAVPKWIPREGTVNALKLEAADEITRLRKDRDELVAALEMVCKIECVDDLWKAQAAIAKLGADKTGE